MIAEIAGGGSLKRRKAGLTGWQADSLRGSASLLMAVGLEVLLGSASAVQDFNPIVCRSFFMPEDQHRGRGKPASPDGIAQDMLDNTAQWPIDEQRIYVAGISSAGGATAGLAAGVKSVLAAGRPDGLGAVRRMAATPPLGRRRAPRRRSEVLTPLGAGFNRPLAHRLSATRPSLEVTR